MDEKKDDENEEEKKGRSRPLSLLTAVRAARKAIHTLGAAGAVEVKASKRLKVADGVGDVRLEQGSKKVITLDCAYADAVAAANYVTDRMIDSEKPAQEFDAFWGATSDYISAAGHHKLSISGALYAAQEQCTDASRVAAMVGSRAGTTLRTTTTTKKQKTRKSYVRARRRR